MLLYRRDEMTRTLFYGRAVTKEEVSSELLDLLAVEGIESLPALRCFKHNIQCVRCGNDQRSEFSKIPCSCGENCMYCLSCMQMSQLRLCSKLWHLQEENDFFSIKKPILTWQGRLSQQQAEASQAIVYSIKNNETRLIWAVAGAGKTEMLFEGIAYALAEKKRVCLASPRIDVCLELMPRLKQAFAHVDFITLYGEMTESYRYTQMVLATTHQLLRFKEAFDVLIIDEIDAFPYKDNKSLYYATERARKKCSTLIYLTATPDQKMQDSVRKQKLLASILPARYHGHALPEPRLVWSGNWSHQVLKQPQKSKIIKIMQEKLRKKRRFLVFVPNIKWMHLFEEICKKFFPINTFTSVYSQDSKRQEKVMAMREDKLDFLITTTILERGVTFKNIDVLVIGSEEKIYTESALVQIAGRAGRSFDYPKGDVILFHHGRSKAMKLAVKQIRQMNHLARKKGLIN